MQNIEPYALIRTDIPIEPKPEKQKQFIPKAKEPAVTITPKVKVILRADKEACKIYIDEITTLSGIPKEAWDYKLGNRSAIEWILDQYKEKKPKDPTIAEKFNCYKLSDYKEEVIELLKKISTVSVKTIAIIDQMH